MGSSVITRSVIEDSEVAYNNWRGSRAVNSRGIPEL